MVVTWLVRGAVAVAMLLLAASIAFGWHLGWSVTFGLLTSAALIGYVRTVASQIRYFEENPDTPLSFWNPLNWPKIYRNTHRAYWEKENYDRWLSLKVGFARHALSIDENRADFPRVEWGTSAGVQENEGKVPKWLDQIWFAGCHSDVGGSYPEDESRLSDIALQWMVGELRACMPTVIVREDLLVTTPDPLGLQHDEVWMAHRWYFRKRWKRHPRLVEAEFGRHPSVVERLEAVAVPNLDSSRPYRPAQLAAHPQAIGFFTN